MKLILVFGILLPLGGLAQFHSFSKETSTKHISLYSTHNDSKGDELGTERISDSLIHFRTEETLKTKDYTLIKVSSPLRIMRKTSDFGYRKHPVLKQWRMHRGVDLAGRKDTVFSVLDGKVIEAGYNAGFGYHLRIQHAEELHSLYAHLSQYYYKTGDVVKSGEPIGLTGATGMVTGEHLHFEINHRNRSIDPVQFLTQIFNYNNIMKDKTIKESALEKLRQIAQSEEAVRLSEEESEFLTIDGWDEEDVLREEGGDE